MEVQYNKLFDNLHTCFQGNFPDTWTHNSVSREMIQKMSDIFKRKNNTEIRSIIKQLTDLKKKFYMNRDKIMKNVPKANYPYYNEQNAYISQVVDESLNLSTLGHVYLYPIQFAVEKYIHVYDRNVQNIHGYIDTIPKYLECHIELYEKMFPKAKTGEIPIEEPLSKAEQIEIKRKLRHEKKLKREQELREEETFRSKREELRKQKALEEEEKEEKERLREEEKEENERLKEEEREENERLREEVKRFMENENCKKGRCLISGGKNTKKTNKNKSTKRRMKRQKDKHTIRTNYTSSPAGRTNRNSKLQNMSV